MKYKYIIIFNAHNKYKESVCQKAETLEDAYQFMTKWYLKEEKILSQAKFWEKYPLNEIEKSIIEKGFYNFTDEDEIQTVNFYINNYIKEVL